jgi:hypothetical protein
LSVQELAFVTFNDLFLKKDLTPSILGKCNLFNSIPFLTILNAFDVPIGGVQVLLDTSNNRAFSLDLTCPKHLNVQSPAGLP